MNKCSLNNLNHKDTLNFFHINTWYPPKNIEELEYLLDKTKVDVDVIDINESSIKKENCPINGINLKDYSYESYPSESSAVDTVIH